MPKQDVLDRFEQKYIPEPNSGCFLWLGTVSAQYGQFWNGKKPIGAHRFAWEVMNGPIPPNLTIDHRHCRVKLCVNPAHMVVCSQQENMLQPDGNGGINAAKTHCKNGHPFDDKNTIHSINPVNGRPRRSCRACWREKHLRAKSPLRLFRSIA